MQPNMSANDPQRTWRCFIVGYSGSFANLATSTNCPHEPTILVRTSVTPSSLVFQWLGPKRLEI
jgi:hypothetical protein